MMGWPLLLILFHMFVFPAHAHTFSTTSLPDLLASHLFQRDLFTRGRLNSSQVTLELGALVTNTTIYGPDDPRFEKVTERFNTFAIPNIQLVVEPGVEGDIAVIVTYCAQNSIDFLPVNRGHGYPLSLASFTGIQINMTRLTAIKINHKDTDSRAAIAETAWFQAGVYTKQVTDYLWERGYIATTGTCECVGLLGPGLGGGHGKLEGTYGLVSDNIRQLNVVLADGSAITVNRTSHADLFWAMRGAGHNFGIVTSFELNVFPRTPETDTWTWNNYAWRGKYLANVFEALNKLHGNGSTPIDMAFSVGNLLLNTSVSSTEPVLTWSFAYRGSSKDASALLTEVDINDIPSISHQSGESPYPDVARIQGFDTQSPVCSTSLKRTISTAGLQVYNITTEQRIFDSFVQRIAIHPEIAASTFIMHEGYATAAVEAGDRDDSAYPFRDDHHLMLFHAGLPHDANQNDEDEAWRWAFEVRGLWNEGQPGRDRHDYVNYANGFEDVSEIYGEEWRVNRLEELKERYDPENKFRFYNPIGRD
ncbi:FAD-binding oxidoreductase [Aspergillus stella-maris]|uniref:FAD-binding oxidoreductase n=1 Tax=Aspergillus stella-maris TaxID=1810926 RepID=UPI003CCCEE5E